VPNVPEYRPQADPVEDWEQPGDLDDAQLIKRRESYNDLRNRINGEVDRNPEAAAAILRRWLTPASANTDTLGNANNNGAAHTNGNANGAQTPRGPEAGA
jgi:hypothetical protein